MVLIDPYGLDVLRYVVFWVATLAFCPFSLPQPWPVTWASQKGLFVIAGHHPHRQTQPLQGLGQADGLAPLGGVGQNREEMISLAAGRRDKTPSFCRDKT